MRMTQRSLAALMPIAIACSSNLTVGGVDPDAGETTGGTSGTVIDTDAASGGTGGDSLAGSSACATGLVELAKAADCGYKVAPDPAADCAGGALETEPPHAVLQLVVDVSGSMNYSSAGTDNRTKWEVTRDALKTAITELASTIAVGISFYPNKATPYLDSQERSLEACIDSSADVPIALLGRPDSAQRAALIAALDGIVPNAGGGTPTHDAYDLALGPLLEPTLLDPREGSALSGPRYLLLITDGQPTYNKGCLGNGSMTSDIAPNPIIESVRTAYAATPSVKTYIIGSPGSEEGVLTGLDSRWWLSSAAREGGTALSPDCSDTGHPSFCHFDMATAPNFATALSEGLRKIIGQVLPCDYAFILQTGYSLNLDQIRVYFTLFDGTKYVIPRNPTLDNCDIGWQLFEENTAVAICNSSCLAIQRYPDAVLEVWIGCNAPVWVE